MGYVGIKRDRPSRLTQAISTLYPLPGNNFHCQHSLPREHKGRGDRKLELMSIGNSIRAQIPPIHPEGYPFIGGFALASLILFWIWSPLGWIGTVLTIWCALFFRDPVRVTPVRDGIVVAPADGRVSMIAQVSPPDDLGLGDRPLPRVSIFMSVFNCHVNRSPVGGGSIASRIGRALSSTPNSIRRAKITNAIRW